MSDVMLICLISGMIVGFIFGLKAGQMSAIKKLSRSKDVADKDNSL